MISSNIKEFYLFTHFSTFGLQFPSPKKCSERKDLEEIKKFSKHLNQLEAV